MADIVLAYITAPSVEVARGIAETVVSERLAACANILPAMQSVYRWQGEIETADETVLILKTTAALFDVLSARVTALHPYETPCIVALPVVAGRDSFLDWIGSEVK